MTLNGPAMNRAEDVIKEILHISSMHKHVSIYLHIYNLSLCCQFTISQYR